MANAQPFESIHGKNSLNKRLRKKKARLENIKVPYQGGIYAKDTSKLAKDPLDRDKEVSFAVDTAKLKLKDLILCKFCDGKVAKNARACPHCGGVILTLKDDAVSLGKKVTVKLKNHSAAVRHWLETH